MRRCSSVVPVLVARRQRRRERSRRRWIPRHRPWKDLFLRHRRARQGMRTYVRRCAPLLLRATYSPHLRFTAGNRRREGLPRLWCESLPGGSDCTCSRSEGRLRVHAGRSSPRSGPQARQEAPPACLFETPRERPSPSGAMSACGVPLWRGLPWEVTRGGRRIVPNASSDAQVQTKHHDRRRRGGHRARGFWREGASRHPGAPRRSGAPNRGLPCDPAGRARRAANRRRLRSGRSSARARGAERPRLVVRPFSSLVVEGIS